MDPKALKALATTQLKALSQMAKDAGLTDLEQQFNLFVLSLNTTSDMPPTPTSVAASNDAAEGFWANYEEEEDDLYEDLDDDLLFEEDEEPTPPTGFRDQEHFESFVEEQEASRPIINDEGEIVAENAPDDVHGVIPDGEGGYTQVGDLEESLETVSDLLEESNTIRDEETGEALYVNEPDDVDLINIKFTRAQGELTSDDVENSIFNHPQAQPMLNMFGREYRILRTENPNEKVVAFTIDQDNTQSRKMAQLLADGKFVQFGGRIIVPGIGQVTSEPIIGN